MKLIIAMFASVAAIGTSQAFADGASAYGEVDVPSALEGYNPDTDAQMDLKAADPIGSGTVDVPPKFSHNTVYIGASSYGVAGCQNIAGYYGFKRVKYFGPYVIAGYWSGYWSYGYWVPVWIPPYTVTYCYGVRS